ncbi:hypothetical protein BJ742DRAFT_171010 [Cladochytrium replicatum]|nr:hypothetical protein BJ742DRAFT_171010 [Cladochytrium replicatum]
MSALTEHYVTHNRDISSVSPPASSKTSFDYNMGSEMQLTPPPLGLAENEDFSYHRGSGGDPANSFRSRKRYTDLPEDVQITLDKLRESLWNLGPAHSTVVNMSESIFLLLLRCSCGGGGISEKIWDRKNKQSGRSGNRKTNAPTGRGEIPHVCQRSHELLLSVARDIEISLSARLATFSVLDYMLRTCKHSFSANSGAALPPNYQPCFVHHFNEEMKTWYYLLTELFRRVFYEAKEVSGDVSFDRSTSTRSGQRWTPQRLANSFSKLVSNWHSKKYGEELMDNDLLTMLEETKNFNASGSGSVGASPPLSTGTTHVGHDGTPLRSATLISTPDETAKSHWDESVVREANTEYQEHHEHEKRDPRNIPYQPDTCAEDPSLLKPMALHPSRLSMIEGSAELRHHQSFEQQRGHYNVPRQTSAHQHAENSPWNPERTPQRGGWKTRGYHDRNEHHRWGDRDGRRLHSRNPPPNVHPPHLRRRSRDANNRDDGSHPQRRRRKRTVTVSESSSSSSSSSSSGSSSSSEDGSSSEDERRQMRAGKRRKVKRESDHRNGRPVRGQHLPSGGEGALEMEVHKEAQPVGDDVLMADGLEGKECDVAGSREARKRRRSLEYETRNGSRTVREHENNHRYDRRSVDNFQRSGRVGGPDRHEINSRKEDVTETNYHGKRQLDERRDPRSNAAVVERTPGTRFAAPAGATPAGGGVSKDDHQAMNREDSRPTERVRLRGRWDTPTAQVSQTLEISCGDPPSKTASNGKIPEPGRQGVDAFLGEDEDELRSFYRLIPPPPPIAPN